VEKMTDYVRKNNTYTFDRDFIRAVLTYDKNKRNQKAPVEEEAAGYNTKSPERFERQTMPTSVSDLEAGDKVKRAESIETEALAMRCCIIEQKCSISWLQRRLSASFNTIASIVERLEKMGYLGKLAGGQKNRAILLTAEQFNQIYPDYAISPEELLDNE
jgi:DNA segregation ATPase FtsK/SpoIIIE-like protein